MSIESVLNCSCGCTCIIVTKKCKSMSMYKRKKEERYLWLLSVHQLCSTYLLLKPIRSGGGGL